jgi:hypothetical protein
MKYNLKLKRLRKIAQASLGGNSYPQLKTMLLAKIKNLPL